MIIDVLRKHFLSREFLLYSLIGFTGIALDLIIFFLLHTGLGVPSLLATIVSVSTGIINNFILNRKYNFKRTDNVTRRFLSFYAVGVTGIVISFLFIILFQHVIGSSAGVAKIISVPFIVVFQFLFNKHVSFAEKASKFPTKPLIIFGVIVLCIVVSGVNGPHANFSDEHDNLLGGRLIYEGEVIYRDFFSHHMPLQYFLAVPFYASFRDNLIAIKVVFGIILAFWLLIISKHIYKKYRMSGWVVFVSILTITQMLTWSNMFLAETFTAYAALHLLILFWCRKTIPFNYQTLATYTLLCSIPILSSLSFLWVSILGYLLLMIHGWQWFFTPKVKLQDASRRLLLSGSTLLSPYLLLIGYLIATGALSSFKEQAFLFNTHYYSQFVTEVGSNTAKSLQIQVLSILKGIEQVLITPETGKFIYRSLFAYLLLFTLILATLKRKWLELSLLALAFVLTVTVRDGFINAFLAGRAGTVIGVVGIAILFLYLFEIRFSRLRSSYEQALAIIITAFFSLLVITSISIFVQSVEDYQFGGNLVAIPDSTFNIDAVINNVNYANDYYWVGPMDFYSQIKIHSKNASSYKFYLPWHAACQQCKSELLHDLQHHLPNIVYWEDAGAIHGHHTKVYGKEIGDLLQADYYQVSDQRLKFFYFIQANKTRNNERLQNAGYIL